MSEVPPVPPEKEQQILAELDHEDHRATLRERALVIAVLALGIFMALLAGYVITDIDEGYRSIRCETGDVVLVLEKTDGTVERVTCEALAR